MLKWKTKTLYKIKSSKSSWFTQLKIYRENTRLFIRNIKRQLKIQEKTLNKIKRNNKNINFKIIFNYFDCLNQSILKSFFME